MKNIISNWRSVPFSRHGRESVPESAGVYAILRVNRVMGLPMRSEPVYIGKSTNLHYRMASHLNPATAHNEEVGSLHDRESHEFWCNLMPSDQITEAEKTLIQVVNPKANKIRY